MKNRKIFYVVIMFSLIISNTFAAGYQLNEYSTVGLGRSFAGAGITGDDYSSIAFNPAGMTLIKKSGIQAGLTMTQLRSSINGFGHHENKNTIMDFWVPLPSFFGQYNINDRWFIGGGVYAPFGLATKYDRNGFLKDKAILSELEVIDTNLSLAYKVNDKFSLGASAILRYIYGHMTNSILNIGNSDFELDGWTTTATFGAMYEFSENNRLGLSYKFKSKQTVKGDHKISGLSGPLAGLNKTYTDGKSSPDLPSSILLSYFIKPFEKFSFTTSLRWTEWSVFDIFSMTSTGTQKLNVQPVIYNWKDSYTFSFGTDYYYNNNWTFRFGVSYDQSPSRNDSKRTIRIPDNDKIWVSTGLSYIKDNIQLDFGFAHLFLLKTEIKNSLNNDYDVKYKNTYSNMFSTQIQYKF